MRRKGGNTMRKSLSTPPKCWGVIRKIVKDWMEENGKSGEIENKAEIKEWAEKDHLTPDMVKPFRKFLRHVDEKSEKDLGAEMEAFEYWTAGPVGIARSGQYKSTDVYGVSDEAAERMRKGPETEQLDYDNPARWS